MAPKVLLDTDEVLLQWDANQRAVIMTRTTTELPRSKVALRAFFERLVEAIASVDRPSHDFVIDARETVGRNDDAFETVRREFEQRLFGGFRKVSVVVKTRVGELQVRRYNDAPQNEPMDTFLTVDEALEHGEE